MTETFELIFGCIMLLFYIFIFVTLMQVKTFMNRVNEWLARQERMEWYKQMELRNDEKWNG